MNIQFKQILKAFTFLFIISFTSCEKDLYEDNIKVSSKNIKVSHISLNDLDKTTSSKITEKISLIKKMNKKDSTIENRIEYDSSLEMYIDTENGKLIDNNGELSYTFPMFRTSEEHLENIIFKPISSGEIETYVSKYNVKPEEFVDLTYQEISTLEPELQKMSASGWYIICVVSQTQTGVTPIDNGDLTGNFGYEPVWETTGTSCYFIDNTGSSPNYSPIVIPNNPSSNGGGGATTNVGVSTSPGTSPELQKSKRFDKQLTSQQKNCLSNLTADQKTAILDFSSFNPIVNCDGSTLSEDEEFNLREEILNETCSNSPSPEPEYNDSNYPGKEDGMPYQWWLDQNYIKNNLKIAKDSNSSVLEEPNAREVLLFAMYPIPALIHIKNSKLALTKALELVDSDILTHILNGKADAYRHAFWNARDTADFGSFFTKLFTDAHEWNSCNDPLETQMDFFNNQQGRTLGSTFNVFSYDSEISNVIITALYSGSFLYLSPLTGEGNILPTTQILPTNL